MGKILWVIVIVIAAVALYNAFTKVGDGFKFESLSYLFKIPSGLNRGATSTISFSVGKVTLPISSTPAPFPAKTPEPPKPTIIPPAGFTLSQLSPYYSQVKIYSISQGDSYNPSRLSIRTGSDYSNNSPINITGWSVKANKGTVLFLPGAVSDFNPLGLTPASDIIFKKGDYANFYSNFSPVGVGFRLNQCMGYLNSIYKFNPSLPNNCPAVYQRSEIITFSGACQNLITSLGGCSVPSANQINSIPAPNEGQCRALLSDRFNYGGCYRYHRGDANFFSNEWQVWINTVMNFDWSHDRLLLLDRNNLLVDEYIY